MYSCYAPLNKIKQILDLNVQTKCTSTAYVSCLLFYFLPEFSPVYIDLALTNKKRTSERLLSGIFSLRSQPQVFSFERFHHNRSTNNSRAKIYLFSKKSSSLPTDILNAMTSYCKNST